MAQIGETSQALLFYEKIKVSDTDSRFHKHWAINSICRELINTGKKEQAIELAKKSLIFGKDRQILLSQ